MPAKNKVKQRTYLTDEKRKVLDGLLDEWGRKADKRSRDAFISYEALPKIQQLNLSKYGLDIISKDKAAKELWDRRAEVSLCSSFSKDMSDGGLQGCLYLVYEQQTIQG